MGGRGCGERVLSRDRDAKSRLNRRLPELRKLSGSGNGVVSLNLKTAAALWFWFDSVGMRDSSAFTHEIQTSLKFFTASQREHRVNAIRGQFTKAIRSLGASCVDHGIRTELSHQAARCATRCGCENPCA